MLDLLTLTVAWANGWADSRGTPPPVPIDGGLVINGRRFVLEPHDWARAAGLGRELTTPGTEIKIVGSAARLREALSDDWTMYPPHHLMTTTFTRGVVTLPPDYTALLSATAEGQALYRALNWAVSAELAGAVR